MRVVGDARHKRGPNARWHTNHQAKETFERKGIQTIYNVPARPEYNPIELFFSQAKRMFNKKRLMAITMGMKPDPFSLITECFSAVSRETIRN